MNKIPMTTPGEILLEEFLKPLAISQNKLALDIRVPANRINAIINGKREITADTAIRLGKYFKTGAEFWINLQSLYNLRTTEEIIKDELKFIPACSMKAAAFA